MKELPTRKYLKECFYYDAADGKLLWKRRPPHHFASDEACKEWNDKWENRLALNSVAGGASYRDKHYYGRLDFTNYPADRVIFKIMTGKDAETVYHLNGKLDDNRIENLSDDLHSVHPKKEFQEFVLCWAAHSGTWAVQRNIVRGKRREYSICREFQSKSEAIAYKNNRENAAHGASKHETNKGTC